MSFSGCTFGENNNYLWTYVILTWNAVFIHIVWQCFLCGRGPLRPSDSALFSLSATWVETSRIIHRYRGLRIVFYAVKSWLFYIVILIPKYWFLSIRDVRVHISLALIVMTFLLLRKPTAHVHQCCQISELMRRAEDCMPSFQWYLQAKFTLREPHSWDPRQTALHGPRCDFMEK